MSTTSLAECPPEVISLSKSFCRALKREIDSERAGRMRKEPSSVPNTSKAWTRLARTVQEYDTSTIGSYKEDIDTLLVFAGLFSAVLATFSVESYKLLQSDSAEASVAILGQISQQLNSFSVNPSFVNASQQVAPQLSKPFEPSRAAVLINVFWFLSLAFSLATASLAMLVKQWLRAYLSNDSTSPQAQARVRYFRHHALLQWNVFEIASLLPSLLQFALALFFIALSIFLHSFHRTVGIIVTVAIALWFAFYGFVLSGPLLSSSCPYQSPSLNILVDILRPIILGILRALPVRSQCSTVHRLITNVVARFRPSRFSTSQPAQVKEVQSRPDHDGDIWEQAEQTFFDDQFVKDTIHICLEKADGPRVLRCVQGIVDRRSWRKEPQNLADHGHDSVSLALVNGLISGVQLQAGNPEGFQFHTWMAQSYCFLADGQAYCSDKGSVHMGDFIYAVISRDWPIARKLLRYRSSVSLATFVEVFMARHSQRHSIIREEETKLVIRNVIHTCRDLLAYGELQDDCQEHPVGPGNPSEIDLPSMVNALLACLRYAPHEYQTTRPTLVGDLHAVIELLISVSQRWVEQIDRPQNDYFDEFGWKRIMNMFSYLLRVGVQPLPDRWQLAFKDLHERSLRAFADL